MGPTGLVLMPLGNAKKEQQHWKGCQDVRLWEWLKKGWNSYAETAHVELMAYLPTWDESRTEHSTGSVVYNDNQDETGKS